MNYSESNDAIFKMLWPVVSGDISSLLGYTPLVYWPDKVEKATAPTDKVWMRVSRKTLGGPSLAGFTDDTAQSARRYDVAALLYVQVFYPQSDANASDKFPAIVQMITDALGDKHDPTNILWTRSSSVDELDSERSWFRKNVVTQFEYQEIKRF
jgi:hypothetical protein